jgi:tetratricopeptide (TPR) repeat protein
MVEKEGRRDLREELGKLLLIRSLTCKRLGRLEDALRAHIEGTKYFAPPPGLPESQRAAFTRQIASQAEELRRLIAARPRDADRWAKEAEQNLQSGTQLSREGDAHHAVDLFEEAIVIYRRLTELTDERRWVRALAKSRSMLGVVAMSAGRYIASVRALRGAMDDYERLFKDSKDDAELYNWGNAALGLAVVLNLDGQVDASTEVLNSADARLRALPSGLYQQWRNAAESALASQ